MKSALLMRANFANKMFKLTRKKKKERSIIGGFRELHGPCWFQELKVVVVKYSDAISENDLVFN